MDYRSVKNSIDTNLSSFTIYENTMTDEKMRKLASIQNKKTEIPGARKILAQDCGEMLKNANREIKNISYKLSTIISNGDYYVKVMAKYPEELEVIEESCMYCKIEAKSLPAPAKFSITYRSGGD